MRLSVRWALAVVVSAGACAREAPTRPDVGVAVRDDAGASILIGPDGGELERTGAEIYGAQCAVCHGFRAEGRAPAPALDRWTRSRDALVGIVDQRMPTGNPSACVGTCAARVADYILAALQRPAPTACDPARRPARQLRLLTRREYVATVRDLFGSCREHSFVYTPPAGPSPSSVVIAGTFNGWAPTVAEGGWPMIRDGASWRLSRELPDGRHSYKLVIDGTQWIADPSNPNSEPDGFGGHNSVIELSCAGEADPWTLTASFPPESRPPGFPFDDHAAAATMTIVRLDEHWAVARSLAEQRARRLAESAGCTTDRGACADRLVDGFATRAYRRPLDAAERARLRAHLLAGSDAVAGVARFVRAVLASPSFLYRSELGSDASSRLTPYEIASALSYGLWGTLPDEALLARAAQGQLDDRAGVEAAVRALLADPRARGMLQVFAEQWLGLERVLTADKRTDDYPAYDLLLRQALVDETTSLFAYVVLDGSHTLRELFSADYTFATPTVAALYALPAAGGGDPPRISLVGSPRRGILGHGSVLAAYAYSDQSSPVRRGVFVRERLLCQHLGVPPPNAGGIPEVDPNATTRERFQQHSADPFCASCHTAIDPIGFGFERFDALGRVRDTEAGRPIDATGDLIDLEGLGAGTHAPFNSIADLGRIIADSRAARLCLAEQYDHFARGVSVSPEDLCHLEDVVAKWDGSDDLRELIVAIYSSPAFLERE